MFYVSATPRARGLAPGLGVLLFLFTAAVSGAEISSNGFGGGLWSDPTTWRGGKVPGPDDEVVVQKNDVVRFDRATDDKPACRKLLIDPRGGFTFEPRSGKLVFAVRGGIDCFGILRIDGTKSPNDEFELRLAGDFQGDRVIKLNKGAALLCYGHPERTNVSLVSPTFADVKVEPLAVVEAAGSVMVEWRRVKLHNIKLAASKIDNTGARPNEKLKVQDCRFTGIGRVWLQGCDTPEVTGNRFEYTGTGSVDEPALAVSYSPLAEIRKNTIVGKYASGISLGYQGDSVLIGNRVEKCPIGIIGGGTLPNTMIKETLLLDCVTGVQLDGAGGVIEDLVVTGAKAAFVQSSSNLQLTGFRVKDLADKGSAVTLASGTLSLLNCELKADQVMAKPQKVPKLKHVVRAMQYVVVAVRGAPPGSLVEMRSPGAPAGAADPDVRNSPAPLVEGRTPPPTSLTPLVVQAWALDPAGKPLPVTEYTVKVLGPAPREGADRPVLKMTTFRPGPGLYRAADDSTPTLEVSLP